MKREKMMKRIPAYLAFYAVVLFVPFVVTADIFSFSVITANDPTGANGTIGENQLFMNVDVLSPGLVSVLFTNTGPNPSVITEIYFDSPAVVPPFDLNVSAIINDDGVQFIEDAHPANLPGGNVPLIAFLSDEEVEAGNPASKKGINPNEQLTLQMTYTDPPHDFIAMLTSGALRVGLHVTGIGTTGQSESFVNNKISITTIPEPASMVLLGVTSMLIAFVRRRLVS